MLLYLIHLLLSFVLASTSFAGSENPLSEGGNWTISHGSGVQKVSGVAEAVAVGEFSDARWSGTALPSNQYQQWTVTTTSNGWVLYTYIRLDGSINGYQFWLDSTGQYNLNRQDAGVGSTLGGGSIVTLTSPATFRFGAIDDWIIVTYNNTRLILVNDATYSGTGRTVGFIPHVTNAITDIQITDWQAGEETTPNIFAPWRMR